MVLYDLEDLPPEPEDLTIISRADWGAGPPDEDCPEPEPKPLQLPAIRVQINCTGSKICYNREQCCKVLQFCQQNYIECGYYDIIHNFMIGADGMVYEGRGWDLRPDLVYGKFKERTIDIAFIGWFDHVDPLPIQLKLAKKFINYGIQTKKILRNHKETWYRDESK